MADDAQRQGNAPLAQGLEQQQEEIIGFNGGGPVHGGSALVDWSWRAV
jgi:hypothetical protein